MGIQGLNGAKLDGALIEREGPKTRNGQRAEVDQCRSGARKVEVFASWIALLAADFALKILGLRRVIRLIANWTPRLRRQSPEAVTRVFTTIDRAGVYYSRRVLCLQRSIAAVFLLRAKGIPAEMVIGFARFPCQGHAWVEIEGSPVHESVRIQDYVVVLKC